MAVRLGSANPGDRVRALDGIDRDPVWSDIPPLARPVPGEVYVVQSAGYCQKPGCPCGGRQRSYFLKGLPVAVQHIEPDGNWSGTGLKDEWFTTEGAKLQ